MSGDKKYGLVLPGMGKSQTPKFQAKRNVFGDESDSEDDSKKIVLFRPNTKINRQAKITQEKAVMEDPTVYQYDEIYDSMSSKKEETKSKSKEEKKPKYIENLMKSANKRKIENERRLERQVQKEREKEGDDFADKEVFVTSAYKKKLEEMRLEEEKEKREEYLEKIGDVTKQANLDGFYRHLYEQKLGTGRNENTVSKETELNEIKKSDESFKTQLKEGYRKLDKSDGKKRNYRKRKASSEITKHLSEGEIEDSDDEINRLNLSDIREKRAKQEEIDPNLDADSDFSVNDPSSEDEDEKKIEKQVSGGETPKLEDSEISLEDKKDEEDKKDMAIKEDKVNMPPPPPKPKIDIWKKRTVGEVFDQALKRFYERKAARGM